MRVRSLWPLTVAAVFLIPLPVWAEDATPCLIPQTSNLGPRATPSATQAVKIPPPFPAAAEVASGPVSLTTLLSGILPWQYFTLSGNSVRLKVLGVGTSTLIAHNFTLRTTHTGEAGIGLTDSGLRPVALLMNRIEVEKCVNVDLSHQNEICGRIGAQLALALTQITTEGEFDIHFQHRLADNLAKVYLSTSVMGGVTADRDPLVVHHIQQIFQAGVAF